MTTKTQGHAAHSKDALQTNGLAGEFGRPIKITMLGAGSVFTPKLVSDVLQIPGAECGQIALVDIDPDRLKTVHELIKKLIELRGCGGKWEVCASVNRAEVMADSHYLVNCIEVSGVECVAWDNDIPLKYGIDQCIGDTIGPGGLFKALRTVPVFLEVLKDIERLCPDAILLNYTNPMSMMCLAAGRTSNVQIVGLCHSVQGTSQQLADYACVPYSELDWQCAGINHLSWFTKLQHKGNDLYPLLLDKVKDHAGETYESDPVRFDMMMHFGAFITESSGHLSEYLPYYRKSAQRTKEYCRAKYLGESRFYADNWPTWRKEADTARTKMLAGEESIDWSRTWEYASWIIEAREKNTPYCIYGNVMNGQPHTGGQLINNLPGDGCVEVACFVDGDGIHPSRFGALPPQMAHVCASNMAMFDLGATACMQKSKEAAIHALLLDPLTAAICAPAQIKQMTLEMFAAERDYLPGFN